MRSLSHLDPAFVARLTVAAVSASLPTASLVLWHRADALTLANGDYVNTWADSSGTAAASTASGVLRPRFDAAQVNGLPAVRFGTELGGSSLAVPLRTMGDNYHILAVVKMVPGQMQLLVFNTSPVCVLAGIAGPSNMATSFGNATTGGASATNATAAFAGFALVEWVSEASSYQGYCNGVSLGSVAGRYFGSGALVSSIGPTSGFSQYPVVGWVAELAVFADRLTGTEQAARREYFRAKYALY